MTDAELSRQEWIEERIAIMVESGMPESEAIPLARKLWWFDDQRKHAPRSHGDGPGAHGAERTDSFEG
jgi:hypothetical protein